MLHFDTLDQHFHEKIYRSFKGRLRLNVLARDFNALNLNDRPKKVLDIGGGSGIFSLSLAEKGHDITLIEPSTMIEKAELNFSNAKYPATFFKVRAEEIDTLNLPNTFDLILLHAVLEWTESPKVILEKVLPYLKKGGVLSLLFYNKQGLIFHNLIRGNFRVIEHETEDEGTFKRHPGSLTPINPLSPVTMKKTLSELGLSPLKQSGIRVFHDYMTKKNQEKIEETERIEMELHYGELPEYCHTARYLHWVYQK